MIGDFNIRDSNWNPLYPYYSIYADVFREVANSFNLEMSMPFYKFLHDILITLITQNWSSI